jgi:arginase
MNNNAKDLNIIGVASGIAANNPDCALGPIVLRDSPYIKQIPLNLHWQNLLYPEEPSQIPDKFARVAELAEKIAQLSYQFTHNREKFTVFGGDHSCAIGTWSGAFAALKPNEELGLLWIDAHMDSHTPQTTLSGNIHGMPLACLLGYGDTRLTNIMKIQAKLKPENVCLIGVRSFEEGEAELLKNLGVKIFFMDDIWQQGLPAVLQQALQIITKNSAYYGLSIDLDAMDPKDAPGVGVPEPRGISGKMLCDALHLLKLYQDTHLLGIEIVEFNPKLDQEHKTEILVKELLEAIFIPE